MPRPLARLLGLSYGARARNVRARKVWPAWCASSRKWHGEMLHHDENGDGATCSMAMPRAG